MNKELLNCIDNTFAAILWIDQNGFSRKSKYFVEIDYLTNGLLSKREVFEGLYQASNFGNELSIALIKKSNQDPSTQSASPFLKHLKVNGQINKVLLIHDDQEKNIIQKFEKSFSGYKFVDFKSNTEE
jgi:hypothetical protein